jgi:hypothetical protein
VRSKDRHHYTRFYTIHDRIVYKLHQYFKHGYHQADEAMHNDGNNAARCYEQITTVCNMGLRTLHTIVREV